MAPAPRSHPDRTDGGSASGSRRVLGIAMVGLAGLALFFAARTERGTTSRTPASSAGAGHDEPHAVSAGRVAGTTATTGASSAPSQRHEAATGASGAGRGGQGPEKPDARSPVPDRAHATVASSPDRVLEHDDQHEPGDRGHAEMVHERLPLSWGCRGERAYQAEEMTFPGPTPEALREILTQQTRQGSFTLLIQKSGEDFLAALSFTERAGGRGQAPPPDRRPTFHRLVDGFGDPPGVSLERFQQRGYLGLKGSEGWSWLEVASLNWRAVEDGGCERVKVDGHAQIPPALQDQILHTATGSAPMRVLVPQAPRSATSPSGDGQPGPTRPSPAIPLHFVFKAKAVAFAPTPL